MTKTQRFLLRKYNIGLASVLLGASVLALGGQDVHADEATPEQAEVPVVQEDTATPAETVATSNQEEAIVTPVAEVADDNQVTRQYQVSSPALEEAKAQAQEAGLVVTEEPAQVQASVAAAVSDNQQQASAIAQATASYQEALASYQAAYQDYQAKQLEYETALVQKAEADALNAELKANYESELATYQKAQSDYQAALAQYHEDKKKYEAKVASYQQQVADKAKVEALNAAAKATYDQQLAAYNQEKEQYEAAMAAYETAKADYDQKLSTNATISAENAASKVAYESAMATYQQAQEQYVIDLAAYEVAKKAYDEKVAQNNQLQAENAALKASYETALAKYEQDQVKYQEDLAAYESAQAAYEQALASYQAAVATNQENQTYNDQEKAKYEAAKASYDAALVQYKLDLAAFDTKMAQYKDALSAYQAYLTDANLQSVIQELTLLRELDAIHQIEGATRYLTPAAQERIGQKGAVDQYESDDLQASDIVTTSPYTNRESEWLVVKEGDQFSVSYENLSEAFMLVNGESRKIAKIVYHYTIEKLPSKDDQGIAKVDADPTVTLTVGASTDTTDPVKVGIEVEFFDENGQKFDLQERSAIVSLNSLNHWDGAAYVDTQDFPRPVLVQAMDTEGNLVRGTWNPYEDGSQPAINNGEPVVKVGRPSWENNATVEISESNPLKLVAQGTSYDEASQAFVVSDETVSDLTSLNASGAGNGHAIGQDAYEFDGADDVIGQYTVDPKTGVLSYTPKKKFQTTRHQEYVNIGDQEFIKMPNSSVDQDPITKLVTSANDNQYIEHGATFNGESTPTLRGWDDADSPYLYYGGAGVKLTDGTLEFSAEGANADGAPTVYWFAINSRVGFPKNPGDEPTRPTPPTPPAEPNYKPIIDIPANPGDVAPEPPVAPVPPTEPNYKPELTLGEAPIAPTVPTPPAEPNDKPVLPLGDEPTPPVEPVAPTPPIYDIVGIVEEPGDEPTPPEAPKEPTPPTYNVVEVPEKPVAPVEPAVAKVAWHKNYVFETTTKPKVPQLTKTSQGGQHQSVKTPVQANTDHYLPETGDSTAYGLAVFGSGMVALAVALSLGLYRKKLDNLG